MTIPRLEVYINSKNEFCLAKVRNAEMGAEIFLAVDLNELKSFEFEEIEKWLGVTSFKIVQNLYKESFENWNSSHAVESENNEKFDLAMQLMHISLSEKTGVHVNSIDRLFQASMSPNKQMREMIEESWPTIRKRLLSFDSQ